MVVVGFVQLAADVLLASLLFRVSAVLAPPSFVPLHAFAVLDLVFRLALLLVGGAPCLRMIVLGF